MRRGSIARWKMERIEMRSALDRDSRCEERGGGLTYIISIGNVCKGDVHKSGLKGNTVYVIQWAGE